mgnify:CR=1 FL=1|tara:strand:- start:1389 stop:2216 length:828 start_codon:yes stop_codon:yes gene_type:complete
MQLGMTPKSVQVWFQNRRQKLRGQQNAMQHSAAIIAAVAAGRAGAGGSSYDEQEISSASSDGGDTLPRSSSTASFSQLEQAAAFAPAPRVAPNGVHHHVTAPAMPPAALPPLSLLDDENAAQAAIAALPRPSASLGPTLPAWLLNELASVASAEQDLSVLARNLMQRKVDLLENIRRFERQTGASVKQQAAAACQAASEAAAATTSAATTSECAMLSPDLNVERAPQQAEACEPIASDPSKSMPPTPPPPCREDALAGLLGLHLSTAASSAIPSY